MTAAEEQIAELERQTDEDFSYVRDIAALGDDALRAYLDFQGFQRFRGSAPRPLQFLASIGAVMGEDCGPCTRISAKFGRADGIDPALIRGALAGGDGLEDGALLAYRFGRAIATGDGDADELGSEIEARLGRQIRTELAIAAATVRVYPALKRGLGYARSCAATRIDLDD